MHSRWVRTVLAVVTASVGFAATARALYWDERLYAMRVYVAPADLSPGEGYWRLIEAVYEDDTQSGGNHNIYYTVKNASGNPQVGQTVWQGWPTGSASDVTDALGQGDIAMWASYIPELESGPYRAWVDGTSDTVHGMALPLNHHVNFLLTWQRATAGVNDGTVSGYVTTLSGAPVSGAEVTTTPCNYSDTTDATGYYEIRFVQPYTYTVTASKAGYTQDIKWGVTVYSGGNAVRDFTIGPYTNLLTNPGFETGSLTGWSVWGDFDGVFHGPYTEDGLHERSGYYMAGSSGYSDLDAGGICQRVPATPGHTYWASVFVKTHLSRYASGDADTRLGIDPAGSLSPSSPTIQWMPWIECDKYWRQLILTTQATGTYVSIFLEHSQSGPGYLHANCYDDASLVDLGAADSDPPGPVSDMTATPGVEEITVSWTNPTDADFVGTLIRYREWAYPTGPADGSLWCDKAATPGSSDSHTAAAPPTSRYYFAAFAYDEVPNYSDMRTAHARAYAESQGALGAGWNLMSLPLPPPDPQASSALDDVIAAGNNITNALFDYTGSYRVYPGDFTEMGTGVGYWLHLASAATETLAGQRHLTAQEIALLPSWNLIGFPFETETEWASVEVSDGVETKTLAEAAGAGWLEDMAYYYDGSYKMVKSDGTGDDDSLRPWKAYWILAGQAGLTLVIPTP